MNFSAAEYMRKLTLFRLYDVISGSNHIVNASWIGWKNGGSQKRASPTSSVVTTLFYILTPLFLFGWSLIRFPSTPSHGGRSATHLLLFHLWLRASYIAWSPALSAIALARGRPWTVAYTFLFKYIFWKQLKEMITMTIGLWL